eukprot:1161278-Pelagomonas_calceolata.AAC.6
MRRKFSPACVDQISKAQLEIREQLPKACELDLGRPREQQEQQQQQTPCKLGPEDSGSLLQQQEQQQQEQLRQQQIWQRNAPYRSRMKRHRGESVFPDEEAQLCAFYNGRSSVNSMSVWSCTGQTWYQGCYAARHFLSWSKTWKGFVKLACSNRCSALPHIPSQTFAVAGALQFPRIIIQMLHHLQIGTMASRDQGWVIRHTRTLRNSRYWPRTVNGKAGCLECDCKQSHTGPVHCCTSFSPLSSAAALLATSGFRGAGGDEGW